MKNIKRNYVLAAAAIYAVEIILAVNMENKDIVIPMVFATWIVLVSAAAVINIIWLKKFLKQIDDLGTILTVEKNPDKYIEANREFLQEDISPRLKAVIKSNMAMGYCEKNDFNTARKILLGIDMKKVYRNFRRLYYLELAYVNFFLGDYEAGLAIVNEYNDIINELKANKMYEPYVNVIYIFKYIAETEYVKANELLFITEQKFTTINGEINYLKECIHRRERETCPGLVINYE